MITSKSIFYWLLAGLFLVYFQIIIGGITRLTGSGLSITRWEIVTGTLPPMNPADWKMAFDDYKETPQYAKINRGMSLKEFKFIYFWEYFHRLWARIMGLVFLFPFVWFLWKKTLGPTLFKDLLVVIFLAALAASFGWIMVASGLINRPWVNAYKLSIHLTIGVSVFLYLFWSTLKARFGKWSHGALFQRQHMYAISIMVLLFIQLFLGGMMSGMRAALIYPTWPDIGGFIVPPDVLDLTNWSWSAFSNYDIDTFAIGITQFLHRSVAYIIVILMADYFFRKRVRFHVGGVSTSYYLFVVLVVLQIVIGILTVTNSIGNIPLWYGVIHQGLAVLILGSFLAHYFFLALRGESRQLSDINH